MSVDSACVLHFEIMVSGVLHDGKGDVVTVDLAF
jgi:hypothetical protein